MKCTRVDAPGADKTITLIPSCRTREIWCRIRAVPASGRPDSNGHPLHLLYSIARGAGKRELNSRKPGIGALIDGSDLLEVRFGGNGRHSLRYEGKLELTGGLGLYDVEFWEGRGETPPHWHRMPAILDAAATYTLPLFAERIGAQRTALIVIDDFGVNLELGREPVPTTANKVTSAALQPKSWIFTEWWG